jgi:hypothetical protein
VRVSCPRLRALPNVNPQTQGVTRPPVPWRYPA